LKAVMLCAKIFNLRDFVGTKREGVLPAESLLA